MDRYRTLAIILMVVAVGLTSCEEEEDTNRYLKPWLGKYEGSAHSWSASPDPDWNMEYRESFPTVSVEVVQGEADSTVVLHMVFNDSMELSTEALIISDSGTYYANWGGGSSFGSLSVKFLNDSLYYISFQKCGVPCSSGRDYIIGRSE
jgi:hypothetical protein